MSKKPGLLQRLTGKKKSKPESKDIVPADQKKQKPVKNQIKIDPENPMSMIAYMVQSGNFDQLEKFMDLRDRMNREKAERAYNEAMAKFQKECPEIKKTTPVKNKDKSIRYWYAKLDSIKTQIKECMADNGFSYTMKYEPLEKIEIKSKWNYEAKKMIEYKLHYINIICVVQHIEGFSKETAVEVPVDESAYMSDVQKIGSTHSYGNRYAFCGAFGIVTSDDDNDGNEIENKSILEDTKENRELYMYAIVGILKGKLFSDEERNQFKDAVKNGEIITIKQYIKNYQNCIKERDQRKVEINKKTNQAVTTWIKEGKLKTNTGDPEYEGVY